MSDGTSKLYFLDAQTFEKIGQLDVFDDDGPIIRLNELEYIQGEIYANVWQIDLIGKQLRDGTNSKSIFLQYTSTFFKP